MQGPLGGFLAPHCLSPSPPLPPDIDECQEYGAALCGTRRCENSPGSFRCVAECQGGYQVSPSGDCVGECHGVP